MLTSCFQYLQQFSNVIIHPGDFHMMKENFDIMELLLQSSGFGEIAYQTRMYTSGSFCEVMSGDYYNRAWRIYKVVSKTLEPILSKRFLHEKHPNTSNELVGLASDEIDMVTFESLQGGESLRSRIEVP